MDSMVLTRVGDEINEYLALVTEVRFSVPATINETEYYSHLHSQLRIAELNMFQHCHHADRYQIPILRDIGHVSPWVVRSHAHCLNR